jgi:hypothetical protein
MKQNRDRQGAKLSENGIRSVLQIEKKISCPSLNFACTPSGHPESPAMHVYRLL